MRELIRLENFAAGFNSLTVLSDVSLTIPERGITCLMGPGGVGKTTLVRTLARLNDAFPSYWWRGRIDFDGRDYLRNVSVDEAGRLVRLLVQKARLYTASVTDNIVDCRSNDKPVSREEKRENARQVLEQYGLLQEYAAVLDVPVISLTIGQQRTLALIRLVNQGPRCLLLDEPLRDIGPGDEARIVRLLLKIAEERAVVVVTHNQRYAREIGDRIYLLSAGRVVASGRCPEFFESPPNELAKIFVACGNVWPTDQNDTLQQAERDCDTETEKSARTDKTEADKKSGQVDGTVLPPLGMHWIVQGELGSMHKPGLLRDLDDDLAGLRALGVRTLVTLTEESFDEAKLSEYEIRPIHFPIVDMSIPDIALVEPLCRLISEGMKTGDSFIVHCKAGLGRTGTILACVQVYRGASAVDAIDTIRLKNAKYIQTDEQTEFVSRFEVYLAAQDSVATGTEK